MPEEPIAPPEKLVTHALVIGAVKGGVAGVLLGLLPAFMVPGGGLNASVEAARVLAGVALAGAWLCSLDAASARAGDRIRRAVLRFGAGFAAPLALLAPELAIFALGRTTVTPRRELVLLASGLALGVAFVAAGVPSTEPHEGERPSRSLVVGVVAPIVALVLLSAIFGLPGAGDLAGLFVALLATVFLALVFGLAQAAAGLIAARRVALWLEPEVVHLTDTRRPYIIMVVAEELHAASVDPARADALRLSALARIDRLVPELLTEADRVDPGILAPLRAEALLGLGRLDEAEKLPGLGRFAPALGAEVARRRGDLEGAARIAEAWLHDHGEAARDESVRGTAHAILALVRADQGRLVEARAHVEAALALRWTPRAFEYLRDDAVGCYVRDRSQV